MANRFDLIKIFHLALTLGYSIEYIVKGTPAHTTGSAFTAGFVNSEPKVKLRHIDHTVVLIHYNHTTGAHNRPKFLEVYIIDRSIEVILGDDTPRRTSRLDRLKLFTVGDTAADIKDYFPESCSHRHFYQAGVSYLTGKGEYLCSFGIFTPDFGKPFTTLHYDDGNIRPSLYIVYYSRLIKDTLGSRKGRPRSRHTPLAFY